MREEEIDWCIYRIIADGDAKTRDTIGGCTRFELSVIEVSVHRLMQAGLIGRQGDTFTILPFQQTLAHGQVREGEDSPIYLEDGIVKVKKGRESTI
ncbi:MAG: hypothetical protein LUO93_04150 [Methanomicrobiales archaeon]|nr:hypothetical protein [Methanomicrobiales archaeon]